MLTKAEAAEKQTEPLTTVICSSDKGLCGAIHSSLTREVKTSIRPQDRLVLVGDKCKNQLAREHSKNFQISFSQIGNKIPTFEEATEITKKLQQADGSSVGAVEILYNKFVSVISYLPTRLCVLPVSRDALFGGGYEFGREEQLTNLCDYLMTCRIFACLVEGHAAEMAAKRSSMENASKNAGEIIQRLTIQYNRTRQSVITNELIDIITGASAL